MLRKAETLTSLDELNLSQAIRKCFEQNLDLPLSQLILESRRSALDFDEHPEHRDRSKWRSEFVAALDAAGFIRHDLYPRTYRVWRLYSDWSYGLLVDRSYFRNLRDPLGTNEDYEMTPALTDEEYCDVINVLYMFPDREKYVLMAYYGLEDGNRATYGEIAQVIGVTRERTTQIIQMAKRKLWGQRCQYLPPLFGYSGSVIGVEQEIDSSRSLIHPYASIDRLGLGAFASVFLKSRNLRRIRDVLKVSAAEWADAAVDSEILAEIETKVHDAGYQSFHTTSSCDYGFRAIERLPVDKASRDTGVDELDLSARTTNCLMRAGIKTLGQILSYNPESFAKIYHFGAPNGCELMDKLAELGYPEFMIDCTKLGRLHSDAKVRCLGLSIRARECLSGAQIHSIQDAMDYSPADWHKVRGLGSKTAAEIEAKIRAAGYPEFCLKFSRN